jgi:hypothetical protein
MPMSEKRANIMKYTFIHPTKSGGSTLEDFFAEYYSEYIIGHTHCNHTHFNICENDNNPIIVVREPKCRFLSMYKYWKNGSKDVSWLRHDDITSKKHQDVTILDFIDMVKTNSPLLLTNFTSDMHYFNTTWWFGNADYKNIIIIEYCEDLNEKVEKLLKILNIPNQNIKVPFFNISCDIDNEYELENPDVKKFIETYYESDIKLLNTIKNNPELFKCVI